MKTKSLVRSLFTEMFQTERSAQRHPRREAGRLGATPPADAFLAVAAHADEAVRALTELARRRGARPSAVGLVIGSALSAFRNDVADLTMTKDQSYRVTLVGIRHGYDLMTFVRFAARREGDLEMAAWCDEWLARRAPLVEAAAAALSWFAEHPDLARSNARGKRASRPGVEAPSDVGASQGRVSGAPVDAS